MCHCTMYGEVSSEFSIEEQEDLRKQKDSVCFDRLILELTRRCNMRCRHCLRGDAEAVDMSHRTIVKAINMAKQINSITLTGGEPTLVINRIRYVYDLLLDKFGEGNLPPFYIATNGRENQLELASILLEWYANSCEPDLCCVEMSSDIFHCEYGTPSSNVLAGLVFCDNGKQHSLNENEDSAKWLIAEGRGKDLPKAADTKRMEIDFSYPLQLEEFDGSLYIGEDCYVSAGEEIMSVCDCSYESIRKHSRCKLDDLPTLKVG